MREASKPYGSHNDDWYDGPPPKGHQLRLWLIGWLIAVAFVAALGVAIVKVKAQPTLSLPFATVTAVGTTSVQIIGTNPTRRSIQICFPAVAGSVTIAPAPVTPVSLTTGIPITLTATPSNIQCFTPPAYLLASGTAGGAGNAWNAIASAAGPFNVTVLEW